MAVTRDQALEEALRFYANAWDQEVDAERTAHGWVGSIGEVTPSEELCADKGQRAREALKSPPSGASYETPHRRFTAQGKAVFFQPSPSSMRVDVLHASSWLTNAEEEMRKVADILEAHYPEEGK
jgi:hypothetical protein